MQYPQASHAITLLASRCPELAHSPWLQLSVHLLRAILHFLVTDTPTALAWIWIISNLEPGFHGLQAAARAARWAAYGNILRPGVHKQNVFWNTIEDSRVGPSDTPLTCPPGYRRVSVPVLELWIMGLQDTL